MVKLMARNDDEDKNDKYKENLTTIMIRRADDKHSEQTKKVIKF
jgi:hypothetical protein